MKYPIELTRTETGLTLYTPVPDLVKPVYEELINTGADIAFPYWAKIWDSAIALTRLLIKEPERLTGKSVLELGAGIGLPSFTIAPVAASVMVTDADPDAVELLKYNIQHLQLSNIHADLQNWNSIPDTIKADVVLLSDINYAPAQFTALLLLIQKFLDDGSTILLATPQRLTTLPFTESLNPFICRKEVSTITKDQPAASVLILELRK